jgi:glycine hydroxymethyltransferase
VNVQPHSGASANIAAFDTLMKPGDPFVAMSLSQGGHLSHGASVNVSGKWFTPHFYGVREDDGLIDWEGVERAVAEAKPKVLIAGASAYPRTLDFKQCHQHHAQDAARSAWRDRLWSRRRRRRH